MKVSGPYIDKATGRRFMKVIRDDGTQTSQIYTRYLMEQKLGRKLLPSETVDHFDRDKTNDDLDNLVLKDRAKHIREDVIRVLPVTVYCILCNKELTRKVETVNSGHRKGKAGPFCKSCAGRYSTSVQYGYTQRLSRQPRVEAEYYQLPKTR